MYNHTYLFVYTICTVSAAQQDEARNIVIIGARPGQDVELTCSLGKITKNRHIGWLIDHTGPYGVSALLNRVSYWMDTVHMLILLV